MSNIPSLAGKIQGIIDSVLGIPGQIIGTPWNAYRVGATSSGDFPTGWQALGQTNIYQTRISNSKIESALLATEVLWSQLIYDTAAALLGDVYVSSEPSFLSGASYGANATSLPGSLQFNGVALAWHPAIVSVPIGGRVDRLARIMRSQRPDVIRAGVPSSITSAEIQNFPLVLNGGAYGFAQIGQPASWVPIGLAAAMRDPARVDFATGAGPAPPMVRYYGYLPPLPGYSPKEGDIITTEDGASYVVTWPYYQEAGVVGSQLAMDRLTSQR